MCLHVSVHLSTRVPFSGGGVTVTTKQHTVPPFQKPCSCVDMSLIRPTVNNYQLTVPHQKENPAVEPDWHPRYRLDSCSPLGGNSAGLKKSYFQPPCSSPIVSFRNDTLLLFEQFKIELTPHQANRLSPFRKESLQLEYILLILSSHCYHYTLHH